MVVGRLFLEKLAYKYCQVAVLIRYACQLRMREWVEPYTFVSSEFIAELLIRESTDIFAQSCQAFSASCILLTLPSCYSFTLHLLCHVIINL